MLVQIIISNSCNEWKGHSVSYKETEKTLVEFVCEWIRNEYDSDESDDEILEMYDEYLGLYLTSIDFDQSENEYQVTFNDFNKCIKDKDKELIKKYC